MKPFETAFQVWPWCKIFCWRCSQSKAEETTKSTILFLSVDVYDSYFFSDEDDNEWLLYQNFAIKKKDDLFQSELVIKTVI